MKIRIFKTDRSVKLIRDIIATEDLTVTTNYIEDTLGDPQIVIEGNQEEVKTLKAIYEMIK